MSLFFLSNLRLRPEGFFTFSTRWASKKAGGSTRNPKGHAPGKRRGFKVGDGEHVTQGSILLRQLNVRCLPGLNVNIGKDGSLYALESGKVLVTCEKFTPKFSSYWTEKAFGHRRSNLDMVYKKYLNIVADPLEQKFKLVDEV